MFVARRAAGNSNFYDGDIAVDDVHLNEGKCIGPSKSSFTINFLFVFLTQRKA